MPRKKRASTYSGRASFLLVDGRFERDGAVMNVVGERFRALNVKGLVHQSHDFR